MATDTGQQKTSSLAEILNLAYACLITHDLLASPFGMLISSLRMRTQLQKIKQNKISTWEHLIVAAIL